MIGDGLIYNSPEVYMGYSYTACQRSEHLIYNGLNAQRLQGQDWRNQQLWIMALLQFAHLGRELTADWGHEV